MTFTQLKYGFAAVVTGVVITGTTIYVATRGQIKQIDDIELLQATIERCLGTQYGSNLYRVNPPEYIRTFVDGTNTYSRTNTIGFIVDVDLIKELDTKIKALIPYYMDTSTVYAGSTDMRAWTVTNLFATLGIGDGTNQFTKVPAIGTNAARYSGDYPLQIYTNIRFEMYKVLHALEWSQESYVKSVNGSARNEGEWVKTFLKRTWSNEVTGALQEAYYPSWQAECLGWAEDYDYNPYYHPTNDWVIVYDVDTNGVPNWVPPGDCVTNYTCTFYPTWSQIKDCGEWAWYYTIIDRYEAPYRQYSNYVTVATNQTDLAVGHSVISWVNSDGYYGSGASPQFTDWNWLTYAYKQYATWQWWSSFNTNLANTEFILYCKPIATPYACPTETTTNGGSFYYYPIEWDKTISGDYGEFSGMSSSMFYQMDNGNLRTNGDYTEIEFGSDELTPLAEAGSFPTWCDEPTEGAKWDDNTGSKGEAKGVFLTSFFGGEQMTFAIRKWNFSYCTDSLP